MTLILSINGHFHKKERAPNGQELFTTNFKPNLQNTEKPSPCYQNPISDALRYIFLSN